jgi:oligopeptide/dipeptide ABC transporter ATP-binding protein
MVFQDPYGSLNPRMKIGEALTEPLATHDVVPRPSRAKRVEDLLELVGLPGESAKRFPHEFSGGQRQRIAIARALAPEPGFLVADEPVAALDVSVRAQILNVLSRLQEHFGVTLLLIAHDLAIVEQMADRVAILFLGRLVELAPCADLFTSPQHPYTVTLLNAVPIPDPLAGLPPTVSSRALRSPIEAVPGCAFYSRCPISRELCRSERPKLLEIHAGHEVACHYPGELERGHPTEAGNGTF